jgi:Vacuolar sorting protein 39 domain 2
MPRYCIRVYSQSAHATTAARKTAARDVFHTLLTIYLLATPILLSPALDLLAKHSPRVDASAALALIPSHIPVERLESFFTKHIRQERAKLNEARIVRSFEGGEPCDETACDTGFGY